MAISNSLCSLTPENPCRFSAWCVLVKFSAKPDNYSEPRPLAYILMKKILQILTIGILVSCTNQNTEIANNLDSSKVDFTNYWHAEYDTINNIEYLEKGTKLDSNSKEPKSLIQTLNLRDQKCEIELVDIIEDTIIIKITNDEFLTEQMGTTGAYCYLGETVYTLTEIDKIEYVQVIMNEGSHAMPGIYQRADFISLIKEK